MPIGIYKRTELHKKFLFQKGNKPWNTGKKRPEISGKNHYRWKGGKTKHSKGYILILMPSHPHCTSDGYVMEHRLIMEAHLGRILLLTEIVHHINGIVDDNRLENLMLFSNQGKHFAFHQTGKKFSEKTKKRISIGRQKYWEQWRKKKFKRRTKLNDLQIQNNQG